MFSEITMTEDEVSKLKSGQGPTLVRNPCGEVVGVFTPSRPLDDFDRQVLERVRQSRGNFGKTRTTKEVLDRLKERERQESSGCPG